MSTNSVQGLEQALLDVRKAYRLLHGYHRRTLDTAAIIAEQFSDTQFHKTQLHQSPFTSRRDPFDRGYSTWDATPLIDVSFLFVRQSGTKDADTIHRPGDFLLDITFSADSGYSDWEDGDPEPEHFPPPEKSRSELTLLLIQAQKECRNKSWIAVWNDDDYPENEKSSRKWGSGDYKAHYQKVSMSELVDREAIVKIATSFRKRALGAST